MNPFKYGDPVSGVFYLERLQLKNSVLTFIENGINVVIMGPRRYGKTSFILDTMNALHKKNYLTMMVDCVIKQMIAYIDEENCIGCTKCISACPFDAIVGAKSLMHTVLQSDCTGCELCIAPCPVDCISMVASKTVRSEKEQDLFNAISDQRRILREKRLARQLKAITNRPSTSNDMLKNNMLAAIKRAKEKTKDKQ